MSNEEKKEVMERFRISGEIWCLCSELIGQEDMLDKEVSEQEIMEVTDYVQFDVEDDDGEVSPFAGIAFREGQLNIQYGIYEVPFMCIQSDCLQKVLDLLTKYKEAV